MPGILVKVLHSWYSCCSVVVRWGFNFSNAFELQCGVRQGGVPVMCAVYTDGIVDKLEDVGLGMFLLVVYCMQTT